jgi:chromosome segregation ATPase
MKSSQSLDSYIREYQNAIELLTVKQWDSDEKIRDLTLQVASLQIHLDGAQESCAREKEMVRTELQSEYNKRKEFTQEIERLTGNHKHAQQTIAELNTTIALAKKEMEKLRGAHINEEHLARKCVLFANEIAELRQTISPAPATNQSLDIIKYQEQVTRLLNERVKYDCHAEELKRVPCGQCLVCQLKKANEIIGQRVDNLQATVAEDAVENIINNPKSWIAWKREAEFQQKTNLTMENRLKSLLDAYYLQATALRNIADSLQFWNHSQLARTALKAARVCLNEDVYFGKSTEFLPPIYPNDIGGQIKTHNGQ